MTKFNLYEILRILELCNPDTKLDVILSTDFNDMSIKYVKTSGTIQECINNVKENIRHREDSIDLLHPPQCITVSDIERYLFDCMQSSLKVGPQTKVVYYVPDRYNKFKPFNNRVYLDKSQAETIWRQTRSQDYNTPKTQSVVVMKTVKGTWCKLNSHSYTVV